MVTSLSAAGSLTPGSTVRVEVRTKNVGNARAGASRTRVFASLDLFRSGGDLALGTVRIPRLAPGEAVTRRISATVPDRSARGELIGCADALKQVVERRERNNCAAAPDRDLDGWADFTDCKPGKAAFNPGANDAPDVPRFTDLNCDGLDGDARAAVFVSPAGDDGNPGTRARPMRTLDAALAAAASFAKDVYARVGVYEEVLHVRRGVGVFGGYGAKWKRTLDADTTVVGRNPPAGDTVGAVAIGIDVPTKLQLLTLAPLVPTAQGADSYGLRGKESPSLRLAYLTVRAGPGVAGRDGSDGFPGRDGGDGTNGPAGNVIGSASGGTSPVGRVGGNGGWGGNYVGATSHSEGYDGGPGQSTALDAWGRMGGPGGPGGDPESNGGAGYSGDSGLFRGDGAGGSSANQSPGAGSWATAAGQQGPSGTHGHGGGGGGGGGGEDPCIFCDWGGQGGGGGGGAEGGGGGGAGQGGGGSFGIYLDDSAGAIVRNSTVVAAVGGAGGAGGDGAPGGLGGDPGSGGFGPDNAGNGARGGYGGHGGRGGDGGGGAGGPSIGIFGLTPAATPGTTVTYGAGGAGGAGGDGAGDGGGKGAVGLAAAYL